MPIKTAFPDDSVAGRLWAAIVVDYKSRNKSDAQLLRDVDRGFTVDSLIHPVHHNTKTVVESGEVVEFAYATSQYRHLLAGEKLPVPFVFTDFSNTTLYDDQLSYDIDRFDQKLAGQVAQKFKKGSDNYRRELARRIYDDASKRFEANADCAIEATATEAARYHCGACTELSAQIFARLESVGLKPQFNFGYNWKPSMDWLDILETSDQYSAHAWVSIPLGKNGPIAVDTALMQFGASLFEGTTISPREFTAYWTGNRILDKLRAQNVQSAKMDAQSLNTIAPRSVFALALIMGAYRASGDRDAADRALEEEERLSPATPMLALFRYGSDMNNPEASRLSREMASENYNAELDALEKKTPKAAAYLYAQKASDKLNVLQKISGIIKGSPPDTVLSDSNVVQMLEYARKAFLLDPNLVILFRNISRFFVETEQFAIGAKFFYDATLRNSEHHPFIYMTAFFNYRAMKASGGTKPPISDPTLTFAELMSTKLEPNNPRSFILAASVMSARGKSDDALQLLRRGYPLWGDRKPKPEFYWLYLLLLIGKEKTETEFESVFSSFLKDYDFAAATLFAQNFIDAANLRLGPDFNSDGPEDKTRQRLALRLSFINTALEAYPTVRPHLDVMRVIEATCYALVGDMQTSQGVYSRIQNPTRPGGVKKTSQILDTLTGWIKTRPPAGDRLNRILALADLFRKNTSPLLRPYFAKFDVACAILYAESASSESAKQHWHKALEADRPTAVQEAITYARHKNDVAFITIINEGDTSLTPKLYEQIKDVRKQLDIKPVVLQLQ